MSATILTGNLGMLERGEADIVHCAIAMSARRVKNFDFTPSIHPGRYTLYRIVPKQLQPKVWVFLKVCTVGLWIGIFATATCMAAGLSLMHKDLSPLFCLGMVLCHLGERDAMMSDRLKQRRAVRILLFTSCLFGFFMFTSYTADLTSYLTTRSSNINLRHFSELLGDTPYNLNLFKGGQSHAYFRSALPGTVQAEIYKKYFEGEANR